MIDTGTASNYKRLVTCLAELGLNPRDIHLIILTHEHFDHIGATAPFSNTAVIAAHPLAANKIELHDEFVVLAKYLDVEARTIRADIWLNENSLIDMGNYRLQVLHTPGHCSGCICLYEPNHKFMFTGDTVLAGGVLPGIMGSGNISDYIKSLQKLNSLKLDEFYPGHGEISKNPSEDLTRALENTRSLLLESQTLFDLLDTREAFQLYFSANKKMLPGKPR